MDRDTSKKMISEIRAILFNDWDPIRVNENPNLCDEYDGYIGRIMQVLSKNSSIQEIVDLLKNIEKNEIECGTNDAIVRDVATKLNILKKNYS